MVDDERFCIDIPHPGQIHEGRSRSGRPASARRPCQALHHRCRQQRRWSRQAPRAEPGDRPLRRGLTVFVFILEHIGSALRLSFAMFWQVLWPLTLGFLLSAVVETLVSSKLCHGCSAGHPQIGGAGDVFGAASSSCSYAAVAVARTLFLGVDPEQRRHLQFASTNLVFELGLVLFCPHSAGSSSPPSSAAAW